MRRNTINQIGAAVLMGIIAAGNIGFVHSGIWNMTAGDSIDISAMDAKAYQVENVSRQKDGSFIVTGKAEGYQSEIEAEITFDASGTTVLSVRVLSQAETDGLGANIATPEFQDQFAGQEAPFGLKDKNVQILVPGTGAVLGAGAVTAEAAAEPEADRRNNPDRWNPEDQSPEAIAVRNLYQAGLLDSSAGKQPLTTAIADASPEDQAAYRLLQAGLTTGTTRSDMTGNPDTPEAQAEDKLAAAGLTVIKEDAVTELEQPSLAVDLYEIDAVSGATISSAAMVRIVDHAYFFLQDQVIED